MIIDFFCMRIILLYDVQEYSMITWLKVRNDFLSLAKLFFEFKFHFV